MAGYAELARKQFYGDLHPPSEHETIRHGRKGQWMLHFRFNWWSLRLIFWHRRLGGIRLAYQSPSWVYGWAAYGILSEFHLLLPKPRIEEGGRIPMLRGFTRWSQVISDKELISGVRDGSGERIHRKLKAETT